MNDFQDRRPVDPTRRLGLPPGGSPVIDALVQAARSYDIPPDIAAALGVVEGQDDYGLTSGNTPLDTVSQVPQPAQQQAMAEMAMRHLRERASAVGGPMEKQLQAYNGMGMLPAGYYGEDEPIDAGLHLPYGNRVMDVAQNTIPDNAHLLGGGQGSSPAVSALTGLDHLWQEDISRDLDLRRRKPDTLKPQRVGMGAPAGSHPLSR